MPLIGSALSLPMPAGVGVSTASSFSPLDLSPTLWLDASDESTLSGPGGGAVSTWSDKSGNGYNLTQNTSTAQPKTGTATLNGLNVLEYDGADTQWMSNASMPWNGTSLTVFAVYEINASDTNYRVAGANVFSGLYNSTSGSSFTGLHNAMTSTSLYVDGVQFTGTTRGDVYTAVGNNPAIVRATGTSSGYDGFQVGNQDSGFKFGYGTKVAEIIVVPSPTAQQIAATEQYLTEKWIPVPLRVGATAWFDASDTDSITQSGGAVSQWNDKSGNGYHLTQNTSTLQPTTGTNTINGLNVVHYDNDSMLTTGIAFTELTMIAVFRHSSENFMLLGTNSQHVYAGVGQSGSTSTTLTAGMGTMSLRFDGTSFSGTTRGDVYDALDSSTKVVTMELSGPINKELNPFGYTDDSFRSVGDIAEVIVVNGTLTADEITLVEDYLTEKWITPVPEALGAALWLDASDTSTIVESSGSVSEWQDKSGNGNNVTQGTASWQPTTGTRTMNSLNVLDFDGTLDSMVATGFTASQPITVFVVSEHDADSNDRLFDGGILAGATTSERPYMDAGSTVLGATSGFPINTPSLSRWVFDGASSSIHIDGVQSGSTGNSGSTGILEGFDISSTSYRWDGTIAEVAVFDRVLSDAEIAQMEAYLNDKWGIQPIPLQVGATAWFDASDPYTIIETSGAVSEWRDKSGNGYHLTQGTSTDQPTTGSRTINSLNVLDFDGSTDYLFRADEIALRPSSFTAFVVLESDSISGRHDIVANGNSAGYNTNNWILGHQNAAQAFLGRTPTSVLNAGSFSVSTPVLMRWEHNGSTVTGAIDGTATLNNASTVGTDNTTGTFVGKSSAGTADFDGVVAEVIFVDGTLTADEISRVENYLANKWGITL